MSCNLLVLTQGGCGIGAGDRHLSTRSVTLADNPNPLGLFGQSRVDKSCCGVGAGDRHLSTLD